MATGLIGQMVTPDAGNRVTPGVDWALDNGCFNARWTPEKWLSSLDRYADSPGCLFAVVPDVVADANATDDLWCRWWPVVKSKGYPAAYVGQDGCTRIPPGADALFIGGSTEWKLGPHAARLTAQAHQRGMWVHMGRVNSLRRLRYAAQLGVDSVDGTFLAFGPDTNLPKLLDWVDPDQPSFFGGVA